MGVPGLFTFLQRASRRSVRDLQHGEDLDEEVDYLLLDSNGLLHAATQFVFNYGEYHRVVYPYADMTFDEKVVLILEMFFEHIVTITELIRPKKVFYIALDGPAPKGKQSQQRQRRFGSAKRNNEFDSNCITPGTWFMNEVGLYMLYRIRQEISSNKRWRGIDVIFSSVNVPGEGEHKLMEYVRQLPNKELESSFCYVGPDGDLIMLALSIGLKRVTLLREDQYRPGFYRLIDVGGSFSQDINRLFGGRSDNPQTAKNDFVVAGLFVGNDFLPRIQMFVTVVDGLEFMRDTYSRVGNKKHTLTTSSHINIEGLSNFVTLLARKEKETLLDQVLTTDPKKLPPEGDARFINMLLVKHVIRPDPRGSRFQKFDLDYDGYRKEYYLTKLHFTESNLEKSIANLCRDYVKTLVWVYEYYTNGLVDWNWSYMHHYPPMMRDLNVYLVSLVKQRVEGIEHFAFDTSSKASRPFEQLLSVLPPSSSSLLPDEYGDKLLVSPLSEFCPTSFVVDYEGKIKEHEGISLLPFLDYRLAKEVYSSVRTRQYHRDSIGTDVVFRYSEEYCTEYSSKFGVISSNHAIMTPPLINV